MAVKKIGSDTPVTGHASVGESERALGAVSYLGIFWIVPFVTGQKSDFVMYHAKQGIVLSLAWFVVMMVSWIPLLNILMFPVAILLLVINILAIMKTWRGERWELPFLAQYVKLLNL